jgi:alanine racemase
VRSEITIDLGALRANVCTLLRALDGAELWAVVKADAYGHGALDCARAALDAGASALCVATVPEALALRLELPDVRLLVMGPAWPDELAQARAARLELALSRPDVPEGIPVHLKVDTGMGRWGLTGLPSPSPNVVGLMTHLATADSDPVFARKQLERFRDAAAGFPNLTLHAANSAAALRIPESRFDAARCGIALYGLSPFGGDPAEDGLVPVLSWRSELSLVKRLRPGESTGYGRLFVATEDTWIGIVPVGYADGFRRDLIGTELLVDGERCEVVGAVSMDATAVRLDRELPSGTAVTLVGPGLPLEEHARAAGTITYELSSRLDSSPPRARRVVRSREASPGASA